MSDILELKDSGSKSTARIAAGQGFNLFEFHADVDGRIVDVIDAAADFAAGGQRPSGHGIPLLFPFPNRIRHGEFDWEGTHYTMTPEQVGFDRDGNAIHGFCLDRPWRVVDQGSNFAVAQFQLSQVAPDRRKLWPADFLIESRFAGFAQGLWNSSVLSTSAGNRQPAGALSHRSTGRDGLESGRMLADGSS